MKFYTNVAISKNDILYCGYEDGRRIRERIPYKPYLFVSSQSDTKYKTLHGKRVGRIDFDTMREARDFLNQYKDVEGMPVFGLNNFAYTYIYDNFRGDIDYDPSTISVTTLDIEVDIAGEDKSFPNIQEAANEITLITISRGGKKAVFGCQPYDVKDPNVTFYKCRDEEALLTSFLEIWNSTEFSPDIVTGWNVEFFDIPYIINRIARVLGLTAAKRLSPWGFLQENTVEIMGKENQVYVPVGITVLDYMQLYKKFAYTSQERYTLDHICFMELGERKLDYGEYGSLAGLQVGNWEMYVDYNIRDVELVDKLDDKLGLIGLVMAMAYDAKINFQDTFTTVRSWDVIIHNYLMDRRIVVPQVKLPEIDRKIIGGYVKDPQCGMHDWVVSLDLNSLYPHIIMQYNISPDTFISKLPGGPQFINKEQLESFIPKVRDGYMQQHQDYLKTADVTCTANMLNFTRKKQGFLPTLMKKYYEERVIYKNKMIEAKKQYETVADKDSPEAIQLVKDISKYNNLQMAKKIQLNSCYGALANIYFRWYDTDFAEAITSSGQLTTQWIEGKLNKYLNKLLGTVDVDYVIACDTDSVYIRVGGVVQKMKPDASTQEVVAYLDKICAKAIEPYIDQCYEELRDYMNGFEQKMKMKRECIADKAIWTGKKHYILNVYNQEGVAFEKPKLKMMGIEAIRTSTPQVVRDGIKHALSVIMNQTEDALQGYVAEFREDFCKLPFEDVAFPRSVSDMDKYASPSTIYIKGTPINVKGALIYNYHLKRLKLDNTHESIASGQKIKYAYCTMPNPLQTTVLTCPHTLPTEFGMDRYIDRDKQFEKAFLEPIKKIVGAIGWECEKRSTLDAFFL